MNIKNASWLMLKYSGITLVVIFSLLFISTIAFSLILRYQLADDIAYSATDHPELRRAIEAGKRTPLMFDIDGCYKNNSDEQYTFRVNINTNAKIVEIKMIDELGMNFFPPKAIGTFKMEGSVMTFLNKKGSAGLFSDAGWVIGRVEQIDVPHDFVIHSNLFTLFLEKIQC